MKRIVALALTVAVVAVGGGAFADDGTLQDRELQKLFEWSAQGTQPAYLVVAADSSGAQPANPVGGIPEYQEPRGSDTK